MFFEVKIWTAFIIYWNNESVCMQFVFRVKIMFNIVKVWVLFNLTQHKHHINI